MVFRMMAMYLMASSGKLAHVKACETQMGKKGMREEEVYVYIHNCFSPHIH